MTIVLPPNSQSRPVPVYFSDLDALGMVNHAHFPVLFERAWTEFWMERGYTLDSPDALQVVRAISMTYYAPIRTVGPVTVVLWVNRVGQTSVDFGFAVRSADQAVLHAEGSRVSVRLDPGTLRPTAWTEETRKDLMSLVAPPVD
jgi:acyl-CoA thioester hydrolase